MIKEQKDKEGGEYLQTLNEKNPNLYSLNRVFHFLVSV